MPDFLTVLLNGSVRGKLSATGAIQYRHAAPAFRIEVGNADALLARHVRSKIREQHVLIAVHKGINYGLKQFAVAS